jgi:hypothetical protein
MKGKPIPCISNDKFSQEVIFQYWSGCLSGHAQVNQTYPDVVRMWRQFHGYPASGDGIEQVFFQLENSMMLSKKNPGQDPGKLIEGINQYQIADLLRQRSLHR